MSFALARKIADAVLYEGYVLYPYRRSALKNRFRWQFGVVAPRGWSEHGGDPWEMQTECLVEPHGEPLLEITIRFLQIVVRDPGRPEEWEEGVERTIDLHDVGAASLIASALDVPISLPGSPIAGLVRLSAEAIDGLLKLRIRIENLTDLPSAATASRSEAMRLSLIGAHTLLAVRNGAFVSLTDPPEAARAAASSCSNLHTWPVLAGPAGSRDVLLSSPIILQDYPAIAAESPGDFCDATEIDELLTLRVMTLTDEEKREACASDTRARAIVERCDSTSPEVLERLHGAIRSIRPENVEEFFNPAGDDPDTASVAVAGGSIARGAHVRLTPKRRADSMDLFLAGRTAVVESVHQDVENKSYVAVTIDDDPAAALGVRTGRFFYFYPDELELLS
jgi:hypothetical protein